jgi:hypothetical protein
MIKPKPLKPAVDGGFTLDDLFQGIPRGDETRVSMIIV